MRMTIERMSIQNFKGCRNLEINFGDITRIKGMNGTGKTTIPDAFSWVLWNKDSHGNTPGSYDFREKPLDDDGNEIHNLDTVVELVCTLDGKPFTLKRLQKENWVKKRGFTDAVYQGNESSYWINGEPMKLADFKSRIAQITSEEVFRLIGSLSAFNAMDWKKRREQLIALSDANVDSRLLQRDEYRLLADECGRRGLDVEPLRKVLADERKLQNKELHDIPIRIDEAKKSLPVFAPNEINDAEYIVKDTQGDIARIDELIAAERAKSTGVGYKDRILAAESELLSIKRGISETHRTARRQLEQNRDMASDAFKRTGEAMSDAKRRLEQGKKLLDEATQARDKLRSEYSAEYEKKFIPPETDGICPTCHQPLPQDMVQDAIKKARQDFATARKAVLTDIKKKGIDKAAEVEQYTEAVERYENDIANLQVRMDAASKERDEAYEQLTAYPSEPDYSAEPRISELEAQIAELKSQQKATPDEKVFNLEQRKNELVAMLEKHRAKLARRDAGLDTEKRITDLEQRHRDTANRVAELERLIELTERFVQDRCHALEESINEKFPTIHWKLFETQINGGINDVCQAYIPCESGLVSYGSANTAAQINADIEIINVLSKHYDLSLPLFADNSERVNRLSETDAQLISLAVSTDSELKIETEMKEVI